jgi:hypothetical protein
MPGYWESHGRHIGTMRTMYENILNTIDVIIIIILIKILKAFFIHNKMWGMRTTIQLHDCKGRH